MNSRRLWLAAPILMVPLSVFAQGNSFASIIQSTSTYQSNLTKQMIGINGTNPLHSGANAPPVCMPPYQLQRGVNGVVPPELRGDPRYQEYLRCQQNQSAPQPGAQAAPQYAPAPVVQQHQPISVSDFAPVRYGHPVVEQTLADMPVNPQQRLYLHNSVEELFRQLATEFRGNNVAVAMGFAYATANVTLTGISTTPQQVREVILNANDTLAQDPNFPQMTAADRQNNADGLIFQTAMIIVLRNMG